MLVSVSIPQSKQEALVCLHFLLQSDHSIQECFAVGGHPGTLMLTGIIHHNHGQQNTSSANSHHRWRNNPSRIPNDGSGEKLELFGWTKFRQHSCTNHQPKSVQIILRGGSIHHFHHKATKFTGPSDPLRAYFTKSSPRKNSVLNVVFHRHTPHRIA